MLIAPTKHFSFVPLLFPRFCCDFGAGWERREEKRREEEMREGVKWASGDTHKGLSGPVGTQDKCHFTVPDQTGTFCTTSTLVLCYQL